MRMPLVLILAVAAAGACASDDVSVESTPDSVSGGVRPSVSVATAGDALDVVILADSLALGGWPESWAELIEAELGVDVDLHDHSVRGQADYDVVLQRSEVRQDLEDAEIVFISPDPDYLREACPPGTSAPDCVTEFSGQYREQWTGWLDEIGDLSNDSVLRSAQAWAWLAPVDRRVGLVEFMEQMAAETTAHDGLVADANQAFTGSDFSEDPPSGWVDTSGHLTGPGADRMAELLHELGYEQLS